MIIGIFKISGHSMLPTLKPNDRVIISSFFFSHPKVNDIIVFKLKNKPLVKRIKKIENNKIFIDGDNKEDSLKVRCITRSEIIGKVFYKM